MIMFSLFIGILNEIFIFLILSLDLNMNYQVFKKKREILMNALRTLVNNSFKERLYRKKKTINILITFFISNKSGVKTFLKWIVNQCLKGTR